VALVLEEQILDAASQVTVDLGTKAPDSRSLLPPPAVSGESAVSFDSDPGFIT